LEKVSKCKIENSELPEEDDCGYVRNEPLVVKTERLLRNKNFEHTMNGLERILFLKQVAATQFSVLGAVAIVLITRSANNPSQSLGPIFALLFLGMALCRHMYLEKALQQEKIIYGLLKRGENKPSNSGTEEKKTDPE
jgi:hypothetical protein